MSQNDSDEPIKSNSQTPIQINYFNNKIENLENLNLDNGDTFSKENSILNNYQSNTSVCNYFSHNNNTENNQQKKLIKFKDFKNTEKNQNSFILLLFEELISIIKDTNKVNFQNEYNEIKNILNNNINNENNNYFESLINIFKKSLIKIINEKTKEILENIKQYKSSILLLEKDNRYYIQQNFLKQTKIDILENEIDSYIEMEEEFDEMKEKLKYENGKFLHNEKKENEILILRAENSNLKKVIDKNEKTIEEKEHIIETIRKKSSSMINTNNNTIKNSFEFNDGENIQPSSLFFIKNNIKSKFNHNNSNITNFKSYNLVQKIKSPNNNFKTNNNNSQSSKKINFGDNINNNLLKNKKNILTSRAYSRELINKKIKNKVLNMKKIRRINDSCLDNYNKSSAHITNSIMSNNSNNSSSKRFKKNINSFFKNSKNNKFNQNIKFHKKMSSGLTSNNILKNNSNKIIVNSILDNNNVSNNNNSFFFKTSRKKFGISKKNSKTNIKMQKDNLLIRNNHSLIKSPATFNNNDFENNTGMKNNIIINNIIQNSSSVPISAATSKSKEKSKVYENDINHNIKNEILNSKFSNIFNKKDKIYKK